MTRETLCAASLWLLVKNVVGWRQEHDCLLRFALLHTVTFALLRFAVLSHLDQKVDQRSVSPFLVRCFIAAGVDRSSFISYHCSDAALGSSEFMEPVTDLQAARERSPPPTPNLKSAEENRPPSVWESAVATETHRKLANHFTQKPFWVGWQIALCKYHPTIRLCTTDFVF